MLLIYSDWLLFNASNHVWSLLWICSSRISLFFSAAVVVNIWEVPLGNFLSHLVFLLYSSHPLSAPNSAICYTFLSPSTLFSFGFFTPHSHVPFCLSSSAHHSISSMFGYGTKPTRMGQNFKRGGGLIWRGVFICLLLLFAVFKFI